MSVATRCFTARIAAFRSDAFPHKALTMLPLAAGICCYLSATPVPAQQRDESPHQLHGVVHVRSVPRLPVLLWNCLQAPARRLQPPAVSMTPFSSICGRRSL